MQNKDFMSIYKPQFIFSAQLYGLVKNVQVCLLMIVIPKLALLIFDI